MPIDIDRLKTGGAFHGALAQGALPQSETLRELAAGDRIGPFRIERELSRGGMGIVYLAERADGEFTQRVALKWMSSARDREVAEALFRRERDIVAGLEHPGIARLIDGGRSSDDMLWFAMELVEGEPIDAWCREHALPAASTVRLAIELTAALAFAHQRLLIHRDIKPANVLVGTDGRVKLLDFGIARLADQRDLLGTAALTPGFASPEQWAQGEVTVASDVYQLGLLIALLLGVVDAPSAGAHATRTAATAPMPTQPAALDPTRLSRLPRDLAAILARATALAPEQRYASVSALGDDLTRWLDRRPVSARGGGAVYRFGCLLRRHPLVASAAVLGAVALLLMGWRVVVERDASRAEALRAQQQAQRAEASLDFMSQLLRWARPSAQQGRDIPVSEVLNEGSKRLQTWQDVPPRLRGELSLLLGEIQMQRRDWTTAQALLESAYRLLREDPQTDIAALVRSASRLGTALTSAQDRERSLSLMDEVLTRGADVPQSRSDYLMAAKTKAIRLRQSGRLQEAVAALDSALAQPVLRAEEEEEPRITLRMDRAIFVFELGGPDDRMATTLAALNAAEKTFGPDHPETTHKVFNYVSLLLETGAYEQAVPFLERGLAARRRVWGDNHVEFARALAVQAELDWRRGRLEPAQAAIDRAVSVCAADLQSGQRFLSRLLELGGRIADARGDLAGAESRYRRALEPEHVAASMDPLDDLRVSFARLLRRTGKRDQADLMLQTVERESSILEPSHPRRAQIAVERSFFVTDPAQARQALIDAGKALAAARESNDKRSAQEALAERLKAL